MQQHHRPRHPHLHRPEPDHRPISPLQLNRSSASCSTLHHVMSSASAVTRHCDSASCIQAALHSVFFYVCCKFKKQWIVHNRQTARAIVAPLVCCKPLPQIQITRGILACKALFRLQQTLVGAAMGKKVETKMRSSQVAAAFILIDFFFRFLSCAAASPEVLRCETLQ